MKKALGYFEQAVECDPIYARAYTQNPQAADFYAFLKSMDTYHRILNKDSTLVLSTDSDLFNLLKRSSAKPSTVPPSSSS